MDKKLLESAIGEILVTQGFRKKSATWYRQTDAGLQVLNLQKSQYGDQYFVNLCIVPSGVMVEGMPTPKENKCPIRIRLTSLFSNDRAKIEALFDLELQSVDATQRVELIKSLVSSKVVPFFDQLRNISDLKLAVETGMLKGGAVNLTARRALGMDVP